MKKFFIMLSMLFSFSIFADTIKIGTIGSFPFLNVVNIVKDELEKEGYDVKIVKFSDYQTPLIALKNKEIDANFIGHKPFIEWLGRDKMKFDVRFVAPVYDVYVAFYGRNIHKISDIKKNMTVAIPNDPTNKSRALKILKEAGLIVLNNNKGLKSEKDIISNPLNLQIKLLPIPSLVQGYQEYDLAFNWPAHMLKIGLNPTDNGVIKEKPNGNIYAVGIAARGDNINSKKIQDLKNAFQNIKVYEFFQDNYSKEGFPIYPVKK